MRLIVLIYLVELLVCTWAYYNEGEAPVPFTRRRQTLVYVHAFASDVGIDILAELISLMRTSNLYHFADHIYLGIVGNITLAEPILTANKKIELLYETDESHRQEFPTLYYLGNHTRYIHPKSHILYVHTKGATPFPQAHQNKVDWRRLMTYFAIENWAFCQHIMKRHNYLTVGTSLHFYEPWPHYAGNIWWAEASHLSQLPILDKNEMYIRRDEFTARYYAERWLLSKARNETFYNDHYCLYPKNDFYGQFTPRWVYANMSLDEVRPTGHCPKMLIPYGLTGMRMTE